MIFWAGIALLALAGWAATLVFVGKALLPQTKALQVLFAIDKHVDDRIAALIERAKQIEARNVVASQRQAGETTRRQREKVTAPPSNELEALFGATPFGEQPEALEIVEP